MGESREGGIEPTFLHVVSVQPTRTCHARLPLKEKDQIEVKEVGSAWTCGEGWSRR